MFNAIKIKNTLVEIIKYIMYFVFTVLVVLFLLIITSLIPKSAIQENLKESVPFFEKRSGMEEILKRREYTFVHYYADTIILNIINNIDSSKPLESVMVDKYYQKSYADVNYDFIKSIKEEKEPNQQYIRYWHGSIVILRPLLTIFNIEEIYLLNKILLWMLAILLFFILLRKSKKIAIIYIISMILIAFPIVPYCLEYSWTFYIMLIVSIIAIQIEKKGNQLLYKLFFITGILTCFFDFLTTELITFLVPMLLVLLVRKEEGRIKTIKEEIIFLIKSCVIWGIAYVAMWLTKWLLASIILNINALDYVKDNLLFRINGKKGYISTKELYIGSLYENFHNLYPINIIKRKSDILKIVLISIFVLIISIDWKNIRKKWFSLILLFISVMPYMRYLILVSHSYYHSFFTFREQIITIIALFYIIIDCLNYKLLLKEINFKKDNKKGEYK